MALKLIVEARDFETALVEAVQEVNEAGVKEYYIVGPFIQTNIKNRNGRVYPKTLMEAVVEKYKQDRMQPGKFRSYGELGHPDGVEINLDKASHYTQTLDWQGNNCIGKAKILTGNATGRMVQTFLDEKLIIGTSTRGLGTLAKNENADGSKMVTSYEMIASDIVADPSAPQGFVQGILENKEYIIQDNGVIVECFTNLERTVSTLPKDSELKEKLFLEAFENFLKDFYKN